jgi:ribonuclease HI
LKNHSTWHNDKQLKVAHVYNAQGQHVGSINADRLTLLHQNFQHIAATQPHLHKNTHSFAAEVVQLLTRYKDGYKHITNPSQRTKLSNHWATPDRYMAVIHSHFNTMHERYSSPLNYNPLHKAYWTMYAEDAVFGASHDAFSTPWLGASQANPEYESADMEKAVRWAIHSTTMPQTSTTVFVLPKWQYTTYGTWLQHSNVIEYCTVSRHYFPFKTGDHWHTTDDCAYAQEPKWDVKILAVTNDPQYKTASSIAAFKRAFYMAATDRQGNKPKCMAECFLNIQSAALRKSDTLPPPPTKLVRLMEKGMPQQPAPLPGVQPLHTAAELFPATEPLMHDMTSFVYTDGSCIKNTEEGQTIGAAVVKLHAHSRTHEELLVDPAGQGLTNTINRAELSAIQAALMHIPRHQAAHILTDSLASIQMIGNKIYRPTTQFGHCNKDTLQDIIDLLHERGTCNSHTTIGKIKAHIGCEGNELADQAAKHAAMGTKPIHYMCPSNADPMQDLIWPATSCTQEDGTKRYTYAANLNKWARDKAYNTQHCTAPEKGIYAKAWHAATSTSLCGKHSHRFWDNQPINVARTVMRLRWGREYNAKNAMHMNKPYASNGKLDGICPLPRCGLPDGCGHMLGGCLNPDIRSMIIKRHNDAVQLLYKAILASDLGGCYAVMDAGHMPGEMLHSRIPKWMLPNTPDTERARMRPDLLLVSGITQRDANTWADDQVVDNKRQHTVYLIEVGYGSDNCLEDKERTKLEQHTRLVEALQQEGWNVVYTAMPLGTTGGIPNSAVKTLADQLKLPPNQVDKTCNRLHDLAIHTAHALVRKRRYIEYHKDTRQHQGDESGYKTRGYKSGTRRPEHSGNDRMNTRDKTRKTHKNAHQVGAVT